MKLKVNKRFNKLWAKNELDGHSTDNDQQFSVPRIEYPVRDSSKKGSHVYVL